MRFMFIRRADKLTEAGTPPAPGVLDAMEKYHQEMAAAGILLDAVGLKPSRLGVRIAVQADGRHGKTDGPFAETKELIAGAEVEVRPAFEEEDFAEWPR